MNGLLYYPLINPPNAVLRQVALYWDSVATVVPIGFDRQLDDETRLIRDAGLYRPVHTDVHYEPLWGVQILESLLRRIPLDDLLPPSGTTNDRRTMVIAAKLGNERHWLVERGLARYHPEDDYRLIVSPTTQLALISVLAHSSLRTLEGYAPFTDQRSAHFAATAPLPPGSRLSSTQVHDGGIRSCWILELDHLLPMPAADTSLVDILAFRKRHEDERRRLLASVDALIRKLRDHCDDPAAVIRTLEPELTTALADYRAAARSYRLRWVKRSLSVFIALGAAKAGAQLAPDLSWALGVLSGLAVNLATGTTRSHSASDHVDVSYLEQARGAIKDSGLQGPGSGSGG